MRSDSRKIAAGLIRYGLPGGVQDPVLWIEACRRCCARRGEFNVRDARDIYVRLAGIRDWPGQAWRGIKRGLRAASQTILPYLTTIVVLEGPAFVQAVGNIMSREQVDEEAKKKIVDRVKTMATTDAVRWIADQAGASKKDTNKLLEEIERSKMARVRTAVLSVDELESYYTGTELPLYCSKCQHSDYTPTGKIGCTIADDPTVREFLDRFQTDDLMFPDEKCPGFNEEAPINTSETDLAAGGVERVLGIRRPRVADTSSASMIKEVPLEPVPDFDRIPSSSSVHRDLAHLEDDPLFDLLSQAVDEFLKNPTGENGGTYREIIQGIIRQLRKRDRSSIAQDKDYYRTEWADG